MRQSERLGSWPSPCDYARMLLDHYHRTSLEAAAIITAERRMTSRENTDEAFFSTHRDGQAVGHGEGVAHVRVPEELAELEDEFPDGEEHYRVHVAELRPEQFVDD